MKKRLVSLFLALTMTAGAYCLRRRFIRPGIISGPGISRRPGSISRCGFGPGGGRGFQDG